MRFWWSGGEKKVMPNHNSKYHRLATKYMEVVTKDGSDPNIPRMGVSELRFSFPTSQHDPQQEYKACADVHETSSPFM
jgi:hypothetical protein